MKLKNHRKYDKLSASTKKCHNYPFEKGLSTIHLPECTETAMSHDVFDFIDESVNTNI